MDRSHMDTFLHLVKGGVGNLAAYLAAHVLLCLLPAFFIAGAMTALIPKSSITRWLGRQAPLRVSYPAAAAAGSLLAVCSCTIVPLFAGIYRKGAGLGPAITFLFVAPAGNVLALAYTGSILGPEFAVARFVLSLLFGMGIGWLMALLFWRDDASHDAATDTLFAEQGRIGPAAAGVLLALVAVLIAGTLKVALLTTTVASATHRCRRLAGLSLRDPAAGHLLPQRRREGPGDPGHPDVAGLARVRVDGRQQRLPA